VASVRADVLRIAYCFLLLLDQALRHSTELREMIHKKARLCGASSGLLWLDGHFCSAPILYQAITSVYMCACVRRTRCEEKRGGGINTFHLVK
jgi:hypothetical protein